MAKKSKEKCGKIGGKVVTKEEWFSKGQEENAKSFHKEQKDLLRYFQDLLEKGGASTVSSIIQGLLRLDRFGYWVEKEDRENIWRLQKEQVKISKTQKRINILLFFAIVIQTIFIILTFIRDYNN